MEDDVVPIPATSGNFDADACGPVRSDLKPLEIIQPEGPSFEIRGHEIRWQRWRLRVSLHPTEGLVLHTLGYEDGGRVRSILHRASLSDLPETARATAAGREGDGGRIGVSRDLLITTF
jgi:primary-amine oxidase